MFDLKKKLGKHYAKNLFSFEKITKLYIEDFNTIADAAKKDRLSDKKIEAVQEAYFKALLFSFFKCSNMPKEKKLEILEACKRKLIKGKI